MEMAENKEKERKMEMEMGGFEKSKNVGGGGGGGGYSRDRPPEDDCCPICFDDFHFPCRTSCGHWFCSSCMMELWRYLKGANSKQCKCPICGCLILNLQVVQSSLLIHEPGGREEEEEVGKILSDIQLYNSMNLGGLSAFFMMKPYLTSYKAFLCNVITDAESCSAACSNQAMAMGKFEINNVGVHM